MKMTKFLGLIALFIFGIMTTCAQEIIPKETFAGNDFGFYAGGQASTNGLGLNVGYIFNKKVTLRTGFETLNFNKNFNFDENDISYNADLEYKTGGIFLIADYFLNSWLYLSGGASLNKFNPLVKGKATSNLEYGDIIIPSSDVGVFNFSIEPSMKFSPYLGTGFRQFIGKSKRVIYNFETGFYYMGAPKLNIEATGLLLPTADPAHGQEDFLEGQIDGYKIYPVLKFNLAVKLF